MPGWVVPALYVVAGVMVLGSVILVGLAALTASNSDRQVPTRKGPDHKNGNPSDRPKGGA